MPVRVETFATVDEGARALSSARQARYFGGGTLLMRAVNAGDQSFDTMISVTDQALREKIAAHYDAAFADLEGLRLPPRRAGWRHSYQSYVVVLEAGSPVSPATFMDELARLGVSTRVGTYAVHRQPYFRERFGDRSLPFTEEAADRSVALPLFCGLTESDQGRVVEAVRTVWSGVKST